jgi:curved DNA-binding protein CbpA
MDADLDHYATLGVEPSADAPSIRAAYRALAQRYHPDKAGESDADTVLRMVEINAAYHVLGDPVRRAQYDRQREPPPRAPDPAERPSDTFSVSKKPRSNRGPRLRGISARRYARRHRLSIEEVIALIRCGDLPGFKTRGNYYVSPAWRRESVTNPSGDPAGCLLAAIMVLLLVLAVAILFI